MKQIMVSLVKDRITKRSKGGIQYKLFLIVLLFGIVGLLSLELKAEQVENDISLGFSAVEPVDGNQLGNSDRLVFGIGSDGVNQYNFTWYLLGDYDANGDGSLDGKLMFSEYVLGDTIFKDTDINMMKTWHYKGNMLESNIDEYYTNCFSNAEKATIMDTLLKADTMYESEGDAEAAKLFPISANEGGEIYQYGIFGSQLMYANWITNPSQVATWWTRTTGKVNNGVVDIYYVNNFGELFNQGNVMSTNGVRPAFSLDPNRVLFTSAAVDGKISGTVGSDALLENAPAIYNTNTYKATLLDDTRSRFSITEVVSEGRNVEITYEGATAGWNEYISAMIVNENNQVEYYGKIEDLSSSNGIASGQISIQIPEKYAYGTTVTLLIFNEQVNGNFLTDYASQLLPVSIELVEVVEEIEEEPEISYQENGELSNQQEGEINLEPFLELEEKLQKLEAENTFLKGLLVLVTVLASIMIGSLIFVIIRHRR